jgi:hypothetical protein
MNRSPAPLTNVTIDVSILPSVGSNVNIFSMVGIVFAVLIKVTCGN